MLYYAWEQQLDFNYYQTLIRQFIKYPKDVAITYTTLGLCGESGEVAEKFKKIIRDEKGKMSDEFKISVIKELGDVLFYIAALSHELGYDLDEVAELNIEKLNSRQARGVIGGSGDER
jgi:NTP pyrophosphatase (non-canonical NTP hydrolase)